MTEEPRESPQPEGCSAAPDPTGWEGEVRERWATGLGAISGVADLAVSGGLSLSGDRHVRPRRGRA